nr:hypothetical protein [Tanacetum cinerariifolium]
QYTRRTRIAQSSILLLVTNKPASPFGDDSQGEACPTDSGFEADQDRANIAKTSTLPSDSTPRVTFLAADEGSMQQKLNELTALLKARIKLLEDKDRGVAEQSRDDAPIKGRRLDERVEAAERVSDDTEEMATILTSMDAIMVSTASLTIPTAAPIFTTTTESTPYTRRKGKETMVESETTKKKKEYHQLAAELPIKRRIELISDLVKYQDKYAKVLKYQTQQRKPLIRKQQREFYTLGMTLEEIKEKFDPVWKQIQDFIPIGSKEEVERFKRKGLRLEQESVKKLKTSEEVKTTEEVPEEKHLDREDLNQLWALVKETLNIRPATSDKEMELWVALKRLYEPDVEDQLWTHTQNLMHALVEWKLYDTCGVHHVTSKDKEIFMLVEKDYPLRKGLVIVMISYKLQVENYSQMANDLILKIYKIASSLRQQDD